MQTVTLDSAAPRRRPTTSLIVMFVLGTLWCAFFAFLQGDTTWEPYDRGWFSAWVVQFLVVGWLLVYLWRRGSRAWVIVLAPIAIQVLIFLLWWAAYAIGVVSQDDRHDSSTFADAFVPHVLFTLLATATVGYPVVRKSR